MACNQINGPGVRQVQDMYLHLPWHTICHSNMCLIGFSYHRGHLSCTFVPWYICPVMLSVLKIILFGYARTYVQANSVMVGHSDTMVGRYIAFVSSSIHYKREEFCLSESFHQILFTSFSNVMAKCPSSTLVDVRSA